MWDAQGTGSARPPIQDVLRQERPSGRLRLRTWLLALLVICIVAVLAFYAIRERAKMTAEGPAPLIKASGEPYKVKPQEPGGAAPPSQDKLIYSEVQSKADPTKPGTEALSPPAEQPMKRPTAEGTAAGGANAAGTNGAAASAPAAAAPAPTTPPVAPPKTIATLPTPHPPSTATGRRKSPAADAAPSAKKPAGKQVAALAPPPAAARGTGAAHGWQVQLGASRAASDAERAGRQLQQKHAALLGKLAFNIERVDLGGGKGVYFRIQAGPLADEAAASSLCSRLKGAGVACLTVRR